jgi:hypothetical protein
LKSETYYIQAQLNVLGVCLALASGEFETTYKTASGAEVTVKRSADGKFASKGGGSTSSDSRSKSTGEKESDSAQGIKNLLNGKLGKQLKEGIINSISNNNTFKDIAANIGIKLSEIDLKTGVQQAQFSEIVGKTNDTIGNAQKYIKSKLGEIKKGASDSETCKRIGETLVAGMVAGAGAGLIVAATGGTAGAITTAVVAGYATTLVVSAVQDSVRISKRNAYNFEHRFEIAAKKDRDEKFAAMLKKFDDERAQKALLKDVATIAAVKREQSNPEL